MKVGRHWRQWVSRLFPARRALQERYLSFRRLLAHDCTAHELLAELEEIGLGQRRVDWLLVQARYEALRAAVSGMVAELLAMAPGRHELLPQRVQDCDDAVRRQWPVVERATSPPYVVHFAETAAIDPALVGGKAAHLAQVHQELGVPVPAGFAITTTAFYRAFPPELQPWIDQRLATLDLAAAESVAAIAAELTALVETLPLPDEVVVAVTEAVANMAATGTDRFAVRSSARAEDGDLTFAGQYRTVLDLSAAAIINGYRQVVASRYSECALHYRVQHGLADTMTPMAVLVLAMVDAAVSGVMTVGDPGEGGAENVVIHTVAGQGERLVHGEVTPEVIRVGGTEAGAFPAASALLTAQAVGQLVAWGRQIAGFYGQPQDIEWCGDRQGRLFILQCRPLPSGPPASPGVAAASPVDLPLLLRGGERAMGGVGSGQVVKVRPGQSVSAVPAGSVLVAATLPPDYAPLLPRMAAVVVEQGSSVGHCALVAREYGVPTLVQVAQACARLADGQMVTVDADQGEIYAGLLSEVPLRRRPPPETPLARMVAGMLAEISPLHLVDPGNRDMAPEHCRSLHDVIRYAHELGMREMFAVATSHGAKMRGAMRLTGGLPLQVRLLDIGAGLAVSAHGQREISIEQVASRPLRALWQGLSSPALNWRQPSPFDWRAFGEAVMGGGVASADAPAYASYAVVDHDYVHFDIRFGYHYTVVEALAGSVPDNNYVIVRFVGGGAALAGRQLRLRFIAVVLREHGFQVTLRGDLLEATLGQVTDQALQAVLVEVGRLLGATRLLDMAIADEEMAERFARQFLAGRGDFSGGAATTEQ